MDIHPLTEYRTKHGLTMEAFADMVGTNKSVISKWESGKAAPRLAAQRKIAEVTNNEVTPGMLAAYVASLPA